MRKLAFSLLIHLIFLNSKVKVMVTSLQAEPAATQPQPAVDAAELADADTQVQEATQRVRGLGKILFQKATTAEEIRLAEMLSTLPVEVAVPSTICGMRCVDTLAELLDIEATQVSRDLVKVLIAKTSDIEELTCDDKIPPETLVEQTTRITDQAVRMIINRAKDIAKLPSCRTGNVSYMLSNLARNVAKMLPIKAARLSCGSEDDTMIVNTLAHESAKLLFWLSENIPETRCDDIVHNDL